MGTAAGSNDALPARRQHTARRAETPEASLRGGEAALREAKRGRARQMAATRDDHSVFAESGHRGFQFPARCGWARWRTGRFARESVWKWRHFCRPISQTINR